MSSRYSSPSSAMHGYPPLSPPWSQGGSPPPIHFEGPPRAPVMPYAALPPVDGYSPYAHVSPHRGMITPPPTPGELHPILCARSTVVRYDFSADPRTVRMSSSSPNPSFPAWEPVSHPTVFVLTIECEASGQVITVRSDDHRNGITCLDLLSQLYQYFAQPIRSDEWRRVRDPQRRAAMKAAYTRRTGHAYDQHATMRKIDYLMGLTVFKRLVPKRSDTSGSAWLLQTSS